jgi:hypothetical protein
MLIAFPLNPKVFSLFLFPERGIFYNLFWFSVKDKVVRGFFRVIFTRYTFVCLPSYIMKPVFVLRILSNICFGPVVPIK